jgi:hypothetical protein
MAFDIYELARQGKVWEACNQAGVTLSALSTTATGLILTNPWGSGVNMALLTAAWAFTTAPAGASVVGLAMSPLPSATAVTHTTPINQIQSGILVGNGTSSRAFVDTAATTVGTPVFIRVLGGPVAASQINPPFIHDVMNGAIILPPGTSLQFAYVTTAAVGMASIAWTEYSA